MGILTRFSATALGRMVKAIGARPDPATIDFGFTLLTLGEDTVLKVSAGIEHLAKQGIADGKNHDVAVGLGGGGTGLTIHCNDDSIGVAGPALQRHSCSRLPNTWQQELSSRTAKLLSSSQQAIRQTASCVPAN